METPFPAYRGNEPYVFVCYAHEDADVVYPELQRLKDVGVNIWYDEGISPGREWTQELAEAIQGASHFLYFASPFSVESRDCRNEIQFATTHDKPIVAVHLEPTQLPAGLELSIGLAQAILKHEIGADDYQRKISGALRIVIDPSNAEQKLDSASRSGSWALSAVGFGDRPAIAVLPLENLSSDRDQEYFVDGLTEDLIQRLSAKRWFPVIARNSTSAFKGKPIDVRQIAQELKAGYIVQGSVRKTANQIRIGAQLIDASSGYQIWAEKYDRELRDVFALQDEISLSICGAIEPQLRKFEPERSMRQPERSVDAWALLQRGIWHLDRENQEDNEKAHVLLRRASELDSSFAQPFAFIAVHHNYQASRGWTDHPSATRVKALANAEKAVSLDSGDPNLWSILGNTRASVGQLEKAIDAFRHSIRLDPSHAAGYAGLGIVLGLWGRSDEALEVLDLAARFDPKTGREDTYFYAHFAAGRYEEAAKCLEMHPTKGGLNIMSFRVAAYAHLGRLAEARNTLEELKRRTPRISLQGVEGYASKAAPGCVDRLLDGLRIAGLGQ